MQRLIPSPSGLVPLAAALALCLIAPAQAQSGDPIKIAVIAEVQSIAGAATPGGAQIAADEINGKGGVLGVFLRPGPPCWVSWMMRNCAYGQP